MEKVREMAQEVAARIAADPTDRSAVREATTVGEDIQSEAGGEFKLLRTSLGKVMDRMKKGERQSIPAICRGCAMFWRKSTPTP